MTIDIKANFGQLRHLVVLMLMVGVISCDSDSPEPGPSMDLRGMEPLEQDLVNTSNTLAIDIARSAYFADAESNVFISPFNFSMAMGMMLNGTSEEPADAVRRYINLPQYNSVEINKAYSEIRGLLEIIDPDVGVRMANGIWSHIDHRFDDDFASRVMAYYDAEVREFDFERDLAVKMVNRWAEIKSGGFVRELVRTVDPRSGFLYTGATVLVASWLRSFDPELSGEGLFYMSADKTQKAYMMRSPSMPARYFAGKEATLIEIDYGRGYYCFSILMPREGIGLDQLVKDLRLESLYDMVHGADSLYVDLTMPRFRIDYQMQLTDLLPGQRVQKSLKRQFVGDRMFENEVREPQTSFTFRALMQNDLHGSYATTPRHETHLRNMHATEVVIDRPFVFFVREKHTNAILFFGSLLRPQW